MKNPTKGATLGNYRPITYLPITFSLLTGAKGADAVQQHLIETSFFHLSIWETAQTAQEQRISSLLTR